MLRFVSLACVVCTFAVSMGWRTSLSAENLAEASESRLAHAAKVLASDEYEGRGVGTQGIDKAAGFIASEFTRIGLKTDLFDGGPFQKFPMTVSSELGPRENNRLTILGPAQADGQPGRIEFALEKSFIPLAAGGSGVVDAPVVFVGYGISAKEYHFDEYTGVDVKDKVVVLIRKEPQQGDEKSVFNGTRASPHATFMRKLANAYEHGAKAVILVNDDFDLHSKLTSDKKAWREELDKLAEARSQLSAEGLQPEAVAKMSAEINRLAESVSTRGKRMAEGYDELLAFAGAGEESGHKNMPVYFCLRSAIDPVLKQAAGKSLAEIEAAIDESLNRPACHSMAGSPRGKHRSNCNKPK